MTAPAGTGPAHPGSTRPGSTLPGAARPGPGRPEPAPPGPAAAPRPRWRRIARHPLAHLAAALLLIALVQSFVAKVYQVPSASMEQTLRPGDRILVDRIGVSGEPRRGDIVVFERPDSWRDAPPPAPSPWRVAVGWVGEVFGVGPGNTDALVKRIVAGPGETLACCDALGRLTVDGTPADEPYVFGDLPFEAGALDCDSAPRSLRCFAPIRLGDDQYLVLGDNRSDSVDSVSACRGQLDAPEGCARRVSGDQIIGRVFFRFWPLSRLGSP